MVAAMKTRVWVLLLLLAGCQTVAEVREYGRQSQFVSNNSPTETAYCIARVLEENLYSSNMRPLANAQGYEVRAQTLDHVLLIAEVRPTKNGSEVQQWLKRYFAWSLDESIAKSCTGGGLGLRPTPTRDEQ
jgi:hypothetical protein